jgi:hypothetical protein
MTWVFPRVAGARGAYAQAMLVFGFVPELLVALGGVAFVSLVLAVFVLVARFLAKRILGDDDGSSLL